MAYDQDKLAVPQPSPSDENKFEGASNPDKGECADVSLSFAPNSFPKQTGHDSLSTDEALLT